MQEPSQPAIAYHLATLAFEEVGKAGLLATMSIGGEHTDDTWAQKRLDDHEAKLMWALWTPLFGQGSLTQRQLEERRDLARHIHATRLRAAYVSFDDDGLAEPSEVVDASQAEALVAFARSRLELERGVQFDAADERAEDLRWFLEITTDHQNFRMVFSNASMAKLAEFQGDARRWVRWLREQFENAKAEADAALKAEMQRSRPEEEAARSPKWEVRVRLYTTTHSVRGKPLQSWNLLNRIIKLQAVNKKKNELLIDVVLPASVSLQSLWYAAWGTARHFVVALNIGTFGFFGGLCRARLAASTSTLPISPSRTLRSLRNANQSWRWSGEGVTR